MTVLSGNNNFRHQTCETQCVTCQHTLADGSQITLAEGGTRSLSTRERVVTCDENCNNFQATVRCDSYQLPDGNFAGRLAIVNGPPGATIADMRFETCVRPPEVRCTSGGNPPRGCALPGGYNEYNSAVPSAATSRFYMGRYDRPAYTREPWNRKAYLNSFEALGEVVPYGNRYRGGTDANGLPFYDAWYFHVSPDTTLTFYDTPVVDQLIDSDDFCVHLQLVFLL